MMLSRIVKNQIKLIYILVWVMLGIIHFFLLKEGYGLASQTAVADSIVFNFLFGIIGIGLWYMVRFSDLQTKHPGELVFYQISGLGLALLIWLGIGYYFLNHLFKGDQAYIPFLDASLYFRIISGVLYYSLLVTTYYLIINFRELKEKSERESRLTSLLKETELSMLRSQIRPHFLFNSLNSISSLTMTDPKRAQEMVIKLSEFMRYSLNLSDAMVSTLKKDLHHAELYLDIEKVRFGEKLVVEKDISDEALDSQLPAMILQPLLENAVKHGVYEATSKVVVRLRARIVSNSLEIVIGNDVDPEGKPRKGTGTGLKNVEARLASHFGQGDLMTIDKSDRYFEVTLKIPQDVR
ncbi:MAG TPA: histidine kinase [Bacteroidales bacterium]|nr:histidine kinase [Bacteroidales bacterium]